MPLESPWLGTHFLEQISRKFYLARLQHCGCQTNADLVVRRAELILHMHCRVSLLECFLLGVLSLLRVSHRQLFRRSCPEPKRHTHTGCEHQHH